MAESKKALLARIQGIAEEMLPDTDRYKVRFKIRREKSNALYLISFDSAPGAHYWVCSCRGCIAHGQCKHLTAMGRAGRKLAASLPLSHPSRQLPV